MMILDNGSLFWATLYSIVRKCCRETARRCVAFEINVISDCSYTPDITE